MENTETMPQYPSRQEFCDYDEEGRLLPYDTDDDDDMMTDDITPDMLTADTIEEMRCWLADISLPNGYEAASLDAYEVISMVTAAYGGGITQFIADGAC